MFNRTVILLTFIFMGLFSLILTLKVAGQNNDSVEAKVVQVTANDGVTLVGDYWSLPLDNISKEGHPAILLMHDAVTVRQNWSPLSEALVQAGYNVLTVDLRGRGESGGEDNAETDVKDVPIWLEWLRM